MDTWIDYNAFYIETRENILPQLNPIRIKKHISTFPMTVLVIWF